MTSKEEKYKQLKKDLYDACLYAIRKMGLKEFRKTSFFFMNNKD